MQEERDRAVAREMAPNGKAWVKGRMSPEERSLVAGFVARIQSGALRVHRGDLAREMRDAVNPQRPPAFFEKLVSRLSLNHKLAELLLRRRSKKEHAMATQAVTALSLAAEMLEAR